MMQKLSKIMFTTFILVNTSLAFSADAQSVKVERPYIQLSIGGGGSSSSGDGHGAVKLSAGADLTEKFGAEAGSIVASNSLTRTAVSQYLSLTARHLIANKITLVGKLGVSHYSDENCPLFVTCTNKTGYSGMFGGEIKYDVFEHVALAFALEYYGGISSTNGTLGIRYTF